ncbi:MAG: DUF1049 domain-containing protein [Proteobacteria bacterium]|nr:DUF1049 domain-containing protein [Pseudomonadota bacterium]MBU4009401.1 DUF1049 domain-containing protein [Pseudomonadota bacterium]MBU4036429.1 DUF1049 domain-containing protein [Pseudomonadota bacterium]
MKKFKIGLLSVIFGIFGLFVVQNLQFLLEKQNFTINLFFIKSYSTPELPIGIILLICFIAGYIIAYIIALFERFTLKNVIKGLNYTIESNIEKIADLKNEVVAIKKEISSVQKEQN